MKKKSKIAGPREGTLAHKLMGTPGVGLFFAFTVISLWFIALRHALFKHQINLLTTPPLLLAINHLYTGLFITAHDAIHGTVCSITEVNTLIGSFCLLVFAGFDYRILREEHWRHHSHAGLTGKDPDYHRGDSSLTAWFLSFMLNYMSL